MEYSIWCTQKTMANLFGLRGDKTHEQLWMSTPLQPITWKNITIDSN